MAVVFFNTLVFHIRLGEQLDLSESRSIEFKAGPGFIKHGFRDNVGKYTCGFINSNVNGTLMLGVEDSGDYTLSQQHSHIDTSAADELWKHNEQLLLLPQCFSSILCLTLTLYHLQMYFDLYVVEKNPKHCGKGANQQFLHLPKCFQFYSIIVIFIDKEFPFFT